MFYYKILVWLFLGGIVFYNRLCSVNPTYSFSWFMGC